MPISKSKAFLEFPFHLTVLLLIFTNLVNHAFARNEYDFQALCNLYSTTNGPYWNWNKTLSADDYFYSVTENAQWDCSDSSISDPCADSWFGVSCANSSGKVTRLDLFSMNVTGRCPPLLNLSNLIFLDLATNHLSGSLPQISSLKLKSFNLRDNRFSGIISSIFSTLKALEVWRTSVNQLSGSLPNFFESLPALIRIGVHSNRHDGTIPSGIYKISSLRYLRLSENSFSGRLPSTLSSLKDMEYFEIFQNSITGTLPADISYMRKLITFQVNDNMISGTLPDFSDCKNISDIYVHHNRLVGTLSPSLGLLSELHNLAVSSNMFHGSLQSVFRYPMQQLRVADFSANMFTGALPSALFNSSMLTDFMASENCILSEIPADICFATNLSNLAISGLSVSKS